MPASKSARALRSMPLAHKLIHYGEVPAAHRSRVWQVRTRACGRLDARLAR